MALTTVAPKIVNKISTVPSQLPTLGPSFDYTDGSWSVTDIYEGEIFMNVPDQKVYTILDGDVIDFTPITPTPIGLDNVLAVDNATGAHNIIVTDNQKITNTSGKVYQEFLSGGMNIKSTDNLVTPTSTSLVQILVPYTSLQNTNDSTTDYSRIQLTSTQGNFGSGNTTSGLNTLISTTDSIIIFSNETETLMTLTSDGLLIDKRYTPSGSADPLGAQGQVTVDDNYVYVKTSTGWKRSALTSF